MTELPRLCYRPAEVATLLGVSRNHVYNLINRGELRSVNIGRTVSVPTSEIERTLANWRAAARP